MSLIDFIQKIQNEPRHIRIRFLWIAVFVCMFFIVSIWIFSLKYSLSVEDNNKKDDKVSSLSDDMISLKDAFKASIGAFLEKDEGDDSEQTQTSDQNKEVEPVRESKNIKPAILPLSQ